MKKARVFIPLTVLAIGGLMYLVVPTSTSNAQAQQNEQETSLRAKIERLERQVEDLQKKVEHLERRPASPPLYAPRVPPGQPNRAPSDWRPFPYQGQTYYWVPVEKNQWEKNQHGPAVRSGK